MARWEPNALERLQEAAMELFEEHGYDRTTVGDIAARAGLTERTFFRYFVDKREVLFIRSEAIEEALVGVIASAPDGASPLDAVAAGLEAAAAQLQGGSDLRLLRARHALVMKHTELRERELVKLAFLAAAVTRALHARGISEPAASLAAEAGVAVFKVAFERWLKQGKPRGFRTQLRETMAALRAVAADGVAPAPHPEERPPRRG
jgi:AcrR family transcriptional regulator